MGLDERRKIKEHQDKTIPERTKELAEITGCPIAYDIDWESFKDDLKALNFVDNISCHRINMAFRGICTDDMGKQAVKDGIKTIKLKNVKDKKDIAITMNSGILEMHCAYGLGADGMISDNDIEKFIVPRL